MNLFGKHGVINLFSILLLVSCLFFVAVRAFPKDVLSNEVRSEEKDELDEPSTVEIITVTTMETSTITTIESTTTETSTTTIKEASTTEPLTTLTTTTIEPSTTELLTITQEPETSTKEETIEPTEYNKAKIYNLTEL